MTGNRCKNDHQFGYSATLHGSNLWLLSLALSACCAREITPVTGEQPFGPPTVVRNQDTKALIPVGAVVSTPLPTLRDALMATATWRSGPRALQDVFVIARVARGWLCQAFHPGLLDHVQIEDLSCAGLPLAADPKAPLTFVVDSEGYVALLVVNAGGPHLAIAGINANGTIIAVTDRKEALRVSAPTDVQAIAEPSPPAELVTGFVVPPAMTNHAGNVVWHPHYALRSGSSLVILVQALQWAARHLDHDIEIRAIGSRHSWSPVAATDGLCVLPDDMTGIQEVRAARAGSGPLFRVLAGTRIRELNEELQKRDLAIPYLGGFDGQTVGGVFATGTHGSVGSLGPLTDLIRSIDLVCFDGRVLRIEPRRDPVSATSAEPLPDPSVILRQDDELFDAVRVGLGSFGVIHSLVIETVPKYWLREVRTLVKFDDLRPLLQDGGIRRIMAARDYVLAKLRDRDLPDPASTAPNANTALAGHPSPAFHIELLWNPYDEGKVLVTSRHWVDDKARKEYEHAEPSSFNGTAGRELARLLDPRKMAQRPGLTEFLAKHAGKAAIELIELLAKDIPAVVPDLIDNSITALVDKQGYVQRSYRVFNIGDATNLLPSLSATISVPIRNDLWLRAVDIIRSVLLKKLAQGVVQTGPIALRFVAGSSAFLADPEDVCKFEFIFGGSDELIRANADNIISACVRELRQEFGDAIRLHFGQLIPPGTLEGRNVERSFPRARRWRELRDELDPDRHGLTPWLRSILP
jgi:FAD binding domain-containing protein